MIICILKADNSLNTKGFKNTVFTLFFADTQKISRSVESSKFWLQQSILELRFRAESARLCYRPPLFILPFFFLFFFLKIPIFSPRDMATSAFDLSVLAKAFQAAQQGLGPIGSLE